MLNPGDVVKVSKTLTRNYPEGRIVTLLEYDKEGYFTAIDEEGENRETVIVRDSWVIDVIERESP